MNRFEEIMIKNKADGIVFIPVFTNVEDVINGKGKIIVEYDKNSIKKATVFPRSGWFLYKLKGDKRKYIAKAKV
jgi:hypothetical protein